MLHAILVPLAMAQAAYFPGAVWETRDPASVGFDPVALAQSVEFAKTHETSFPRDFGIQVAIFGRQLGPLPVQRGRTNGLVIRHGYVVASFGDTGRIDPTYSAAKSFLSSLAGIALREGKIRKLDERVGTTVTDGGYASPHNALITWEHHLRQTSEWEGTIWGKSDTFIGTEEYGQGARSPRQRVAPGSYYEYNDARINRFALSLLRVFKEPLPEVLKREVMDRIHASDSWRWVPYDNAKVEIEGKEMPSVSGGTRWGGGLWINSLDEARFGLLYLRNGRWKGKQILPKDFVSESLKPGDQNPDYGYLWWLNQRGTQWPGTPKAAFAAVGHGTNTIWIDPEHDLVVVWRWHAGNGADFFRRVVESIRE